MENETSNIESVLKQALQREDAPADFADQLLLRVAHQKPEHIVTRNPWAFFTQPLVRWVAFAAITAALVGGFIHHREAVRERAKGEAAKQQLMLALRIAGSKLQIAREKVNEINDDGSTHPNQEEKE
ncbi:MAG TPA: hypothetical protein VHW45_14510 [Candidatus Sulfotelmatobacter sp.]|nr:hypothetical protein [Candidatus Sulfotelmatobacter sp.]